MVSIVWIPLNDCTNSLLVDNRRDSRWGTSHDHRDGDVEGNRSSSKPGPKDIWCSRCFWVSILQIVLGHAKVLKWFILSCSLQSTTTAPFTAPIPWRRPGVRHNNNEIYFDIEESLDAIVDRYVVMSRPTYSWAACRRGNTLTSSVWGRINCNSRLSGNPDLLLNFSDPKRMHQCSFHPCIRYVNVCICGLTFFSP